MENIAVWQGATLGGIVAWILLSSYLNVTRKLRSFLQPWVAHHVIAGTPLIFQIQKYQHWFFDALFSGLSCVVSVPFYTAFLPLLFWSGHGRLARQMTLLMAFCDYLGNTIKDMVSAPRPSSPPVRRITATKDEEDNALEYGLPSSHTLYTVCLSGYLLHYVLSYIQYEDVSMKFVGLALVCLFVSLIGFGRIYLGMHSLIDIIGGLGIGLVILAFWLTVHKHVDNFIVSGQNAAGNNYFGASVSQSHVFTDLSLSVSHGQQLFLAVFPRIAMGNKKDIQKVKDTKTNFRWSQPMQNLLLEILADEALHGNKQSNTFKHASYAKVAEAITEKFMTECTPKHVEHRFKTLKTNWNTIALLRNKKSGFGWNDDLKMITCDRTVYDEEVEAHPNHAQFLNKKIEMFDEMALVVGKDMATGGFSKGVGDIGVEALDDSPPLVDADVDDISKKKQVDPSHVASNETRSHRKRSHATMIEDAVYQDLSIQLGKVASAIEKISENELNFGSLYEEVMKMDGFEENMLASAFDHLNGDEKQARSFMLKNDKLRRQWLQNFFDNYLNQF